jgi:hypothetical protein
MLAAEGRGCRILGLSNNHEALDKEIRIDDIRGMLYTIQLKILFPSIWWGHAVAHWLKHCTTNRKVAGSIPDGVIRIFH